MVRPKNKKESLFLSFTENCETLIEQTLTKPQETLELKLIEPKEIFPLKPSMYLGLDSSCMITLTNLEV